MNPYQNNCQLCGYAGCLMPHANQAQGTPASWHTDCLQRQIVALRKQVEATQPATVQTDSKPATDGDKADAAELEQWRKAFAWRQNGIGLWVLRVSNTRSELTHISKDSIGGWIVGGKVIYPTIDEAMRAAEAALGLPKCHTEG